MFYFEPQWQAYIHSLAYGGVCYVFKGNCYIVVAFQFFIWNPLVDLYSLASGDCFYVIHIAKHW